MATTQYYVARVPWTEDPLGYKPIDSKLDMFRLTLAQCVQNKKLTMVLSFNQNFTLGHTQENSIHAHVKTCTHVFAVACFIVAQK